MSDIELDAIRSGYNLSKINTNFNKIQEAINSHILHLNGENNVMLQDLDMNSNRIYNLPRPANLTEPLRLGDLSGGLGLLTKPYIVPPFSGDTINLNEEVTSILVTVNGRVLAPDDIELDHSGKVITLAGDVTEQDEVVVRGFFVDAVSVGGMKTPMDYGAAGDGVVDDTSALQAWADAEETYYLGDNNYYFTDTLSFNDKENSVWMPSKGKLIAEVYNKTVIEFINCPNIDVNGLNIDMSMIDAASQATKFQNGVLFSFCPYGKLRNSYIYGSPSQALNVRDSCTAFEIHGNTFLDSGRLRQLNEGTGISVGGAVLVFNSSKVSITSNTIITCWSACITAYASKTEYGEPVDGWEPIEGYRISNNFIYNSQSNGIRVNSDDFPEVESSYQNVISNNVVFNTNRTCIRTNGINILATGNVVGYDLQPIMGVEDTLPNNGFAINNGKKINIVGNTVMNCSAGFEPVVSDRYDYGIEDVNFTNNIVINCVFGVYRSGDITRRLINCNVSDNTFIHGKSVATIGEVFPSRQIIHFRATDGLFIENNKLFGHSDTFDFISSIYVEDSTDVYICDNKLKESDSGIQVDSCPNVIISNNKIKSNIYSGISAFNCLDLAITDNNIRFNSADADNSVGLLVRDCSEIEISRNNTKSIGLTSNTSFLLLAENDGTITKGIITDNIYDTRGGINNQVVGGVANGADLAQFNNYDVRNRKFDNVKCKPVIESTDSVVIVGSHCGSLISYSSATNRSTNVPDGLPIGFNLSVVNSAGNVLIKLIGSDSFANGGSTKTLPNGVKVDIVKVSDTLWTYTSTIPANEDLV